MKIAVNSELEKIKHRGEDISVASGFRVYHGADNIQLGNHICLVNTLINAGDNVGKVIMEDYVFCGHNVMILARDHDYTTFGRDRQLNIREKPIHIKTGVWLCSGAIILMGVTIGEHAVVGAGCVVTRDVPPYAVVAGNPAKVVKLIPHDDKTLNNSIPSRNTLIHSGDFSVTNFYKNKTLQKWKRRTTQPERFAAVLKHIDGVDRILDVGTGNGVYIDELRKRGKYAVGMDINKYEEWNLETSGYFINASGDFLPFQNKSFDVSFAFEVLEHIPRPGHVLQEIHRCTRDKFIFSVPNCNLETQLQKHNLALAHWTDITHCNFFTKDILASLLAENGFKILEMSDCVKVVPSHYFWNTVKLPKPISRLLKLLFDRFDLVETYWSSILVVAKVV